LAGPHSPQAQGIKEWTPLKDFVWRRELQGDLL
jgi:hypothetical protein